MIEGAIKPEVLAKQMGWGVKRVRRLAKKLGACRILGNRMALMPEDIETILEATRPCPSSSIDVEKSGTTEDLLMDVSYEDRLAQRIAKSRPKLQPRLKPETGNVVSMDRKRS